MAGFCEVAPRAISYREAALQRKAERTMYEISRIARRSLHHGRRHRGHRRTRSSDDGWAQIFSVRSSSEDEASKVHTRRTRGRAHRRQSPALGREADRGLA